MKILLVHNYYKDRGGEDVAYDAQINLLRNSGYDVIEYSKKSEEIDKFFKKISTSISSFYSFKTYREIKRMITEEKPDIAHIHNIFPVISPSIYSVLYKSNIPIIHTIHNYRFFCANGLCLKNGQVCDKCKDLSFRNIFNICRKEKKLYNFLISLNLYLMRIRNVYSKISCFIALSNFTKEKLIEAGIDKQKIVVLRNILEESSASDFGRANGQGEKKYFVYVGRLSEEKGILEIVRVFMELKDIKLKVLGNGPLYNKIEKIIFNQRIHNIELLGFIDGKKKYEILRSSYANIVPSICYETGTLAITESFIAGVPVIVNNIGSLPENVTEGKNGYIYNNLDELKGKILKIISLNAQQTKNMANECRASYEKLFDKNMNFNLLVNLYKSILSEKTQKNDRKD